MPSMLNMRLVKYVVGDYMKVELIVDGKKIPMNKFVQKFVGATSKGMVETLDDVDPSWRKIQIVVEKEEE
jgi:hypothetical protein